MTRRYAIFVFLVIALKEGLDVAFDWSAVGFTDWLIILSTYFILQAIEGRP